MWFSRLDKRVAPKVYIWKKILNSNNEKKKTIQQNRILEYYKFCSFNFYSFPMFDPCKVHTLIAGSFSIETTHSVEGIKKKDSHPISNLKFLEIGGGEKEGTSQYCFYIHSQ